MFRQNRRSWVFILEISILISIAQVSSLEVKPSRNESIILHTLLESPRTILHATLTTLVNEESIKTPTDRTTDRLPRSTTHDTYYASSLYKTITSIQPSKSETYHTKTIFPKVPDSAPLIVAATALSSTVIEIIWQPPANNTINGHFKGFLVLVLKEGVSVKNIPTYNTELNITNLSKFTNYSFAVCVMNHVGNGPFVNVTLHTLPDIPSRPLNLRSEQVSSHSFKILWDAPEETFGAITGYKVVVNDISEKRQILDTNIMNTFLRLTDGIRPFKMYQCMVYARNKAGLGSPSLTNITTLQSAPGPVLGLEYSDVTSTSVRILWKEPDEKNGNVFYKLFKQQEKDEVKEVITDYERLSFVFNGLQPFTNYTFFVQSYTKIESGGDAEKKSITVQTLGSKPGTPVLKGLEALSDSSIEVIWQPLTRKQSHGILTSYEINVTSPTGSGKSVKVPLIYIDAESLTSTVIDGLKPYTCYTFKVRAINDQGPGEFSDSKTERTREGKPSKPRQLRIFDLPSCEDRKVCVNVTWLPPSVANGVIRLYKVTVKEKEGVFAQNFIGNITYQRISKLDPYSSYSFEVVAKTESFGEKITETFRTKSLAPSGPPKEFRTAKISSTSTILEWKQPTFPNGPVKGYVIKYKSKYSSNIEIPVPGWRTEIDIPDLLPYTHYQFRISCKSIGGTGPYSDELKIMTKEASPNLPKSTIQPTVEVRNTITITIWKPSDRNGIISFFYIVIFESAKQPIKAPATYKNDELKLLTYDRYWENRQTGSELKPYVAANISRQQYDSTNGTFIIGKTDQSSEFSKSGFVNGPLYPGAQYFYFIRAHINEELYVSSPEWRGPNKIIAESVQKSQTTDDLSGAVAGSVVAVIVICGIAAAYFLYRRRSQKNVDADCKVKEKFEDGTDNPQFEWDEHIPADHPTKIENFAAYVRNLSKDGKYLFSEEFKMILNSSTARNCSYEHSNHPINREKNRYHNIVAYDHTRVLLEPMEGVPESDYINANYIDGYMKQAAYIATQGPIESTFESFWRMCWEQNVTQIVMLTGLVENEKIKCHYYWPEVGSMYYGVMQVTLTDSVNLPFYSVRTFTMLHEEYPGAERFIRQYSFCAWKDHATPVAQQLLTFIRRVEEGSTESNGPVVVHCSAGVGRTGTYIVLDVNLKRIHTERNIEIFNYLQHIRSQRNYMVQTEAQYIFIHDALLEYLTFGITEIQVCNLQGHVKKLKELTGNGSETNLDKEFQKLNHFDPASSKTMNAANLATNRSKNRFLNVLPFDDTRVPISHMPGVPGSDYINASYIHSYLASKLYIATQAPLPQTIPAFWRMVWEHHCSTIVCLSQETENGKVKIHRYWPSIEAAMHGTLMIENEKETVNDEFIVRDFKVTHTSDGLTRNIRHFQYTCWPDDSHPETTLGIIDVICQVQKWHQENSDGQIVVHCSAGAGRTGVFIGLCNLIERVRIEGFADVFQTVREMRSQRPAMVQTKLQYYFCYLALQDFVSSIDIHQTFY